MNRFSFTFPLALSAALVVFASGAVARELPASGVIVQLRSTAVQLEADPAASEGVDLRANP